MFGADEIYGALAARHGERAQKIFASSAVGVAGLGGLGSRVAEHLARLGVGRIVIADFDAVELANIHRQQYFLSDVGRLKSEATLEKLLAVNPYVRVEAHNVRVTRENAPEIFGECSVLCECFDQAEEKAMIAEAVLSIMPKTTLVAASGMAGFGSANEIRTERRMGKFFLCGDFEHGIEHGEAVTSPRVALCAAHQATAVMRILLGLEP